MKNQNQFDEFEACSLYCPCCRQAMPVKKRLLLVLPTGDKYEYICARCGQSVGEKIDSPESGFSALNWPPSF